MENSFCLLSKPYPIIGGFAKILERIKIIREICNGNEKRYQTQYPCVVKLCRLCIADICKELTICINWETTRYKKYTALFEKMQDENYDHLIKNVEEFVKELKEHIIDCKNLYNKYHNLYETLQKAKLYSKACIICAKTKPERLEYLN